MRFCILLLFAISLHTAFAEPWLSNRYAQNCASCHSPGRINLPSKDRRCTLSCQGCHVNPNGGGIRNEYGVWNQQRWLRSFTSEYFANRNRPAPFQSQKYAVREEQQPSDKSSGKKGKTSKTKESPNPNSVPNLVITKDLDYNEKDFDRRDKQEQIIASKRSEFMSRITEDDPYRIERRQYIFAGGDLRILKLDQEVTQSPSTSTEGSYWLPMAFDLGVRIKPLEHKNIQFVFENRYYNYPGVNGNERLSTDWVTATDGSRMRSAYLLVDNLPYASFVQYGIYRPLFGMNTPDHTSLAQSMMYNTDVAEGVSNISADSALYVTKALTIGASPNVPFANLHLIRPIDNTTYPQDEGFAINVGGRFVIYGLSVMLSYWDTKNKLPAGELAKKMIGLNIGGAYDRFIVNCDFTQIQKSWDQAGEDRGHVQTFEFKYRMWREIYAQMNIARANTTRSLRPGNANEFMYGIKSFLLPGTEFEIMKVNREDNSTTAGRYDRDQFQMMMHLYF